MTEKNANAYIVQNVYGKISVYVDTENTALVDNIKELLIKELDKWLDNCENLKDNLFAQKECSMWKESHKPVSDRIWLIEKFLTNEYWNSAREVHVKSQLNSKLISFYSF